MSKLILKAFIDESNCIGCTKCLVVCPTDAIIGAKKKLHTIVPNYCTSCSKCLDVCPTNCISLLTAGRPVPREEELRLTHFKQRRVHSVTKTAPATIFTQGVAIAATKTTLQERKNKVSEAIARAKARKESTVGQ